MSKFTFFGIRIFHFLVMRRFRLLVSYSRQLVKKLIRSGEFCEELEDSEVGKIL